MSKTLHVAYILKRFPRLSETFILHELLALERLGARVTVLAQARPQETTVHRALASLQASVEYAPQRGSGRPALESWCDWAHVRVRDLGPDHVHAHFATSASEVAATVHARTGVPFSFTAHAKDIFHESVDHGRLAHRLSASAFAVTVSDFNVAFLMSRCGPAATRRLRRLYNGIDLTRFRFVDQTQRLERHILCVGRFVEKKGFADALRAVAMLRDRCRPVRLTLVGGGEDDATLRRLAADLRLDQLVTFTGPLAQDAVVDLLGSHTLMAAPCVVGCDGNRDGLPTVLLEAMAVGLPVVSTDVTGIPEMIHDGASGRIVPQRCPEQLAEAIDDVASSHDRRGRYAWAARRVVERRFDLTTNVACLHRWFMTARSHTLEPAPVGAYPGGRG